MRRLLIALAIFIPALTAHTQTTAQPTTTQPTVTATPTFSQSPQQSFPRVSGLADAALQAQANKLLAERERADRTSRTNCLRAYVTGGKASYSELVRLSYLSPRLLSVDVRTTSFCGGPYPDNNMTYPYTLDLTSGRELDWHLFFIDELLNPPADRPSMLLNLYLRHAPPSEECNETVNDRNTIYNFWIDSARHALMVRPLLPHVAQACAAIAAIPFTEIQTQLRNPLDRQDLLSLPNP